MLSVNSRNGWLIGHTFSSIYLLDLLGASEQYLLTTGSFAIHTLILFSLVSEASMCSY